jgi:hypothetical protein
MMDLPDTARAFFDADGRDDPHAVVAAFCRDGSVTDEGVVHQGGDAIRRWWAEAKAKYHHVAVPFAVAYADDKTKVRATVTGRFAGSPASLNYTFTIIGGKIAGLEIG